MNVKWPLMHNNISRSDANSIIDFLSQDPLPILTNASKVKEFEQKWGEWLGTKYNVMVNSGSAANELSLLYLKYMFPEGGEVIVPPLAWVSDVAAVLHNDFTPVFCDIKLNNLALDIEDIKRKITPKTKAILLIHILGYNGVSKELIQICKEKNILLIEDVCESHGATFNGQKVGTFGDISNFSFYYAHHMTSIEGGMICTNNHDIYQLIRAFRSHGMLRETTDEDLKKKVLNENPDLNKDFVFLEAAHNFRSTEINAVLALNQLPNLDINNRIRAENLDIFLNNLNPEKFYVDFDREGNSNYAFTLILKKPDWALRINVETTLRNAGIEFRRGLSGGGNQLRQPYLKKLFGNSYLNFPVTDHCHNFGWYIGKYPELPKEYITELTSMINDLPS
jgi:CDP-6-deoxy-D-xylo-4-hexulose-3-dehydrase